ncbi:MAG: hypothetical protein JSS31_09780 [Proteobacteria bacterium]|nr:hypothetical protein [Pseudomonadota bacterium]
MLAYVRIGKHEAITGGPGNLRSIAQPLIRQRSHAIRITDAAGIGRQRLALAWCANDAHGTGGRFVDVAHWPDLGTGELLIGATAIGVADLDGDVLAHVRIGEQIRGAVGTRHSHAIAQPLVTERPQAVGVGYPCCVGR